MYIWDIYEITSTKTSIHGVMLRGRIRKFALQNNLNLLTENASDKENVVRFALEHSVGPDNVINFLKTLVTDIEVSKIQEGLPNPVLSKMQVNIEDRYSC